MAKYSRSASKKVGKAMHEYKRGKLKSGRAGTKVKSRKQAIAIGLSEARKSGAKVPSRKTSSRKSPSRSTASRSRSTRSAASRKTSSRKSTTRKSTSRTRK